MNMNEPQVESKTTKEGDMKQDQFQKIICKKHKVRYKMVYINKSGSTFIKSNGCYIPISKVRVFNDLWQINA